MNQSRSIILTGLVNESRMLDSTRPITSALNSAYIEGITAVLNDPFAAVLDVVGVNEYIGWYTGVPEDADKM